MYNETNPKSIERYSSAITLSDMEVFIFPELLYSLVLANIMSPNLWKWKNDPWFADIGNMNPMRRLQRLKQYVMDHFSFNLDLDTWGLTTKETEIARFSAFITPELLAKSNALFGYEGDKYYFSSDIRKHFGLDKYTESTIPYWKTETLEAMEAFRHKPGYPTGAGECVSLSTLYAAAAFVVAGIPIDDIFVMATPLHSQSFFDVGAGVLSNNRRIVTKTMWFNGTELSAKARRALENEQVTIVAHRTGYIHSLYSGATIDLQRYERFGDRLRSFLSTDVIDFEVLANFLRQHSRIQCCFQIGHTCCGKPRYIEAEKVFAYEHNSKARVSDDTCSALLHEIEEDEFFTEPLPGRILLGELEEFFKTTRVSLDEPDSIEKLRRNLHHACYNVDQVIPDLKKFCRTEPRLPPAKEKQPGTPAALPLETAGSAQEVLSLVSERRGENETCDLALAAFRDLTRSPWRPFLKAALERNPVILGGLKGLSVDECYNRLSALPDESVYNEPERIAQPDEVWNFMRGDGIEKAISLANCIKSREPDAELSIAKNKDVVILNHKGGKSYAFATKKSVPLPEEKDLKF